MLFWGEFASCRVDTHTDRFALLPLRKHTSTTRVITINHELIATFFDEEDSEPYVYAVILD